MKRRFAIAAAAVIMTACLAEPSFAVSVGDVSLRAYFEDIYKIFSFITEERFKGPAENGMPGSASPDFGDGSSDGNESYGEDESYGRDESFGSDENGAFGDGSSGSESGEQGGKNGAGTSGEPSQGRSSQTDAAGGVQAMRVLELVNEERREAGLSRLRLSVRLCEIARLKAEDMAERGYFSHNSPIYGSAFDMMSEYGINYMTAGENIARGQKDAEAVVASWLSSDGHRDNILKERYEEMGVGCAVDDRGRTCWVQMFVG